MTDLELTQQAAQPQSPLEQLDHGMVSDGIALSSEECSRIDNVVDKLFTLHPMSQEYTALADNFHSRVPARPLTQVEATEATNADLAMELLSDLRAILDCLFPKEGNAPAGWSFRTAFEQVKDQINLLLKKIEEGKRFIVRDLRTIDIQRANHFEGLTKLRKLLLVSKTMREKIEARAQMASAAHRKIIEETAVFYLTQREMDILTEIAVTTQTFLAFDTIRRTNVVLTQNIDRILSTTVQALNNAVFVATNIKANSLQYAFDTRQLVLGFEGKKIQEMIQQFTALDHDIARLEQQVEDAKRPLPAPSQPDDLENYQTKTFIQQKTYAELLISNYPKRPDSDPEKTYAELLMSNNRKQLEIEQALAASNALSCDGNGGEGKFTADNWDDQQQAKENAASNAL